MQSTRKTYLDALRIIAILLVIFNHMPGYTRYFGYTDYRYTFYVLPALITRINVPLFWMISGALLLPKAEELTYIFKHRVSRIFFALITFSTFLYLLENFSSPSLSEYIHMLLNNQIEESYWFLYTYLGILLLLPYLQRIAKSFSQNDFVYFLLLHGIFNSLFPMINYYLQCNYNTSIHIPISLPLITENAFFFFFAGYYLDYKLNILQLKKSQLLAIVATIIPSNLLSGLLVYHQGITTGFTQQYLSLFDYINTIVVFLIVKYMFLHWKALINSSLLHKAISAIGALTFGIYLLDPILKHFLYRAFENAFMPHLPTIICSIIWTIVSAFLCGCITYFLKKMPFIQRIL